MKYIFLLLAVVLLASGALAGCATHYEASYDPVMDAGLINLEATGATVFIACQDTGHVYSPAFWQPLLGELSALQSRAGQTALDTETYKSLVLLDSLTVQDMQWDSSIAISATRPYFFGYAGDTWLQGVRAIDSAELYKKTGRQ